MNEYHRLIDPSVARKQLHDALAAHQPVHKVVTAASALISDQDPKLSAEGCLGLAYAACWSNNGPVAALEYVSKAIALAAYNDITLLVLAMCLQADLLRSVRNYQDTRLVLRLARDHAGAHPWLPGILDLVEGRLLLMTNRTSGSLEAFRSAVSRLAEGPVAFYAFGLCHLAFAEVAMLNYRAAAAAQAKIAGLVATHEIQHSQIVACRELLADMVESSTIGDAMEFYDLVRI